MLYHWSLIEGSPRRSKQRLSFWRLEKGTNRTLAWGLSSLLSPSIPTLVPGLIGRRLSPTHLNNKREPPVERSYHELVKITLLIGWCLFAFCHEIMNGDSLSSPLLPAPPLFFALPAHSYRRPGGPRWVGVETGVAEALFLCLYGKRLANEIPFRGYRQVSSPIRHFSKNTHRRTSTHIFSVSSHLPPLAILITWSASASKKALDSAALLPLFIQRDSHNGLS